jgi:hypothetical protein
MTHDQIQARTQARLQKAGIWTGPATIALMMIALVFIARWVAYLNLWVVVLYLPTALDMFFKSGVFAWNGALVFWVPATAFFIWCAAMTFVSLRAIDEEHRDLPSWTGLDVIEPHVELT